MSIGTILIFVFIITSMFAAIRKAAEEQNRRAALDDADDFMFTDDVEHAIAPEHKREIKVSDEIPEAPVADVPVAEDKPHKKREKIDAKKLVIYSEIMKPKFDGD
ncbi:MAG: hypothetical protein IK143_01725 [Bacteroidales bacterium]|nr:hypothetical protein [Bacteroidales bacterium]